MWRAQHLAEIPAPCCVVRGPFAAGPPSCKVQSDQCIRQRFARNACQRPCGAAPPYTPILPAALFLPPHPAAPLAIYRHVKASARQLTEKPRIHAAHAAPVRTTHNTPKRHATVQGCNRSTARGAHVVPASPSHAHAAGTPRVNGSAPRMACQGYGPICAPLHKASGLPPRLG